MSEYGAAAGRAAGLRRRRRDGLGGRDDGRADGDDARDDAGQRDVDYNVFLKPGALNWWGVVPQDMTYSTYDQDPMLSAEGVPGNVALVDGKGPPDLGGLPFAGLVVQDAAGECWTEPRDIGAINVP